MPITNQIPTVSVPRLRGPESQESQSQTITNRRRGFSLLELVMVVTITLILAAILIPNVTTFLRSYRSSSNARDIASQLALAKMSAAASFTQAELNCTLTGNSCQLAICTTKGATVCTTYTNQGGPILLSQGMSFGYGSITTPAGSQTTISNTNPIVFNSRSIPIDNTGAPTGNDALYVTDSNGDTYALSVYASGRVAVWRYSGGAWKSL
jgi:prepilin-type N-terminal cleavage/methylation domain-containing protein